MHVIIFNQSSSHPQKHIQTSNALGGLAIAANKHKKLSLSSEAGRQAACITKYCIIIIQV
jgi:hypothetical protein